MPIVNDLIPQVQGRLEELAGPNNDGEFWSIQYELRTHLIEAQSDLMVLIGRPTQSVSVSFSPIIGNWLQSMPTGIFLITDIYGVTGRLHRITLHDMDYIQAYSNSAWENDTDPNGPRRWFPLGFNLFGIHPAPSVPVTIQLSGISLITTDSYPYSGTETLQFHDELEAGIEQYASHIARIKEGSTEFQESVALYREYLSAAERNTVIEDRRDQQIFSRAFGGVSGPDAIVKR